MERIINGIPHVPAEEAARELATTHLRVLMLVKQGGLTGTIVEGRWFVSRESLDRFRARGGDVSGQGGCRTACSAGKCGCKGG